VSVGRAIVARARLLAELAFNGLLTHVPIHALRVAALRLAGASIGSRSVVFRGTTVLAPHLLVIGDESAIGFRCMLDARGRLTIGSRVTVASDVHLITMEHRIDSPTFATREAPIVLEEYAWIASRATVLPGVTVHRGGVVGAAAVVTHDVAASQVVAGVPARPIAARVSDLNYSPTWRPLGY
jgi:acetyltransferase-like isoleucine patch superfamily enzyme